MGLFFYAGHGVQYQGRNYLVPVGADIQDEAYVDVMAVDVNLVLAGMDAAKNRLNIVVLDACRNNPFAGHFRSQSRGLAQLSAPTGTFIAYATGPGAVAEDGAGANSSFSAALVSRLGARGADLEQVFMAVRQDVYASTGGSQTPWINSSVMGDFYFSLDDTGDTQVEPEPEPEVVALEPDPGTIVVTVENGGAVKLDGVARGTVKPFGGLELSGVSAGRHVVSVGSEEQVVQVKPGSRESVGLVGVASVVAPAPAPVASSGAGRAGIEWVSIPGLGIEMARSEVTVRQYKACVDAGACSPEGLTKRTWCNWEQRGRKNHPVNCLDWFQASAFARWVGGRLPTEVEWEYAAKGGQLYTYSGSENPGDVAWTSENSNGGTHAVCGKKRNGYGLCDMAGNVSEWTATSSGHGCFIYGGSWNFGLESARVASHSSAGDGSHFGGLGFRPVREAP